MCNICTHGFKLADNTGATARRKNFPLRYGDGLYFSSVSGKANDYAELSEKVLLPFVFLGTRFLGHAAKKAVGPWETRTAR